MSLKKSFQPCLVLSALLLVLVLFDGLVIAGQAPTATMTGIIRDQTGAVLPSVTITVTDMDRNTRQSTTTDATGRYVLGALNPGNYSLTADLAGFRRFVQEGIALQVNQIARVDARLELGVIAESVHVTSDAPALETETSSRGTDIVGQEIRELPLNGRDYNQLALLAPGVVPSTPRLASVNFLAAMNVNGNRVFNNVFLLDGVDNVSYSSSYRGENAQVVQPSIEALQEFRIQTNAYAAEFGRSSGATVNAVIRSGSNALRGSVYEFLRNDALDANNFFSNSFGSSKPERRRNQFGAAMGGPIIRNKTFWFGAYEGLIDREGLPQSLALPSPAEKAGMFNTQVVDPFALGRPSFSRNTQGQWVIPKDRWDPVGERIVALIPDPNVAGTNIFASTPVTRTRAHQFHGRIDHDLSRYTRLFGRYSFVDSNVFRPGPLPGLAEGSYDDAFGSNRNRSQGLAIGLTQILSPSLLADLRLGWNSGDYFTSPPNAGLDGPAFVGLKNVPSDPSVLGGLPKMVLQGYAAIGRHTSTPQFQTPRTWDSRLNVFAHRGRHSLKFGFEYLQSQTKIDDVTAPIGAMAFADLFTGKAVGDLLLGLPVGLELTSNTTLDQGQHMYFSFLQDDYKLSPRLTVNLGIRYEYSTPPLERDNRLANFDPTTGTMQFAASGNTFGRSLIHPDKNDWAPRLGFSYSPRAHWVVRGAYGVFYSHTLRQGREGMLGFNPPFLVDNQIFAPVFGPLAVAAAAPFRLVNGYPQGLLDPNRLSPFVYRRAEDPNQRSPYVQQFNFGIQREISQNVLVDVAYVGNKGTKLPALRNINAPAVVTNVNGSQSGGTRLYPGFGDIQWMENRALSNYHSLQIGLEKRFSSGISALGSYTWSKTIGDAADHLSTSLVGPGIDLGVYSVPQNPNNLRAERGPAEFDVTHRMVVSYIYELPWGHNRHWGQSWNRTTDLLLGDWQVSGIHTVQTGLPLTATLGGSTVLNLGSDRVARPNLVGNPELPASERKVEQWFNTKAFTIPGPAPQAFGNEGNGVMRAPGLANFDFSIAKKISVDESRYFQFRSELFNAFNHPNFGPPDIRRESATFGRILTAASGRIIQFGLKLYY